MDWYLHCSVVVFCLWKRRLIQIIKVSWLFLLEIKRSEIDTQFILLVLLWHRCIVSNCVTIRSNVRFLLTLNWTFYIKIHYKITLFLVIYIKKVTETLSEMEFSILPYLASNNETIYIKSYVFVNDLTAILRKKNSE